MNAPKSASPGSPGRAALIGTVFGLMWYQFGLAAVHGPAHRVALTVGTVLLLVTGVCVFRLFRTPPARRPRTGGVGPRFVTIIVVEAVVLGVGNNYLRTGLGRPELMYTWSALVVGVHFIPMARRLGAPLLKVVGIAMIAVAAATFAVTRLTDGGADTWQAVPCLGSAAILWLAVVATTARARLSASTPSPSPRGPRRNGSSHRAS